MNYDTIVRKSKNIIEELKKEIGKLLEGIHFDLECRIKSEEHMLRKQKMKNLPNLTDVEDIVGLRILLNDEELCHQVYSILVNYYHPYRISNYFEKPKDTGFKAYLLKLNQYEINAEIQIMTHDMKGITEKTHSIHVCRKYQEEESK